MSRRASPDPPPAPTQRLRRRPGLFIIMLALFVLWIGFLLALRLTQVAPVH